MGKNKKGRNKLKQQAVTTPATSASPKTTAHTYPSISKWTLWGCVAFLAILSILLYAGSFNHDFAYDDLAVVKENRFVQKGFSGIGDILRTQYFEGYDPNTNARAYRPVSMVMYAIEQEYFGLNPRAHHLVNILLYALTAIVLFLALLRLLSNRHWMLAFVTTALFVLHPVHVDVVANIKSRDELVGFLNFCLAMLFLLKDLDQPATWKKLLSFIFFFLALASKENLLTTVACIPLLLYFFRDFTLARAIRRTIPYAAIFILFLIVRASVISGSVQNSSPITFLDNPILAAQNLSERIGTNIYSLGLYLQTLVFPYKLSCDYSYNSIPVTGLSNPLVILYLLLYAALAYVAIKGFRRRTIYSFCILWFFITISIVSSVFIMSSNAYADRFLYTPSLAVCLAVAYALYSLAQLSGNQPARPVFSPARGIAAGILIIIAGLCIVKTISYVPVWKNDITLFRYNLKVNPQNARMHKNYGGEMVRQAMAMRSDTSILRSGDTTTINRLAREGIIELEKAKAIYDRDAIGYIHEANAYILLGNFAEAENNLRSALAIDYNNRFGNMSLGYVLYTTGRYREAAEIWERISPEMRGPGDNYNLYLAYYMLGDQQRANYYKQLSGR